MQARMASSFFHIPYDELCTGADHFKAPDIFEKDVKVPLDTKLVLHVEQ